MSITSLNFALFTALALGIYYLLPRRAQNYWLLFVSYTFIVMWGWQFAVALITITTVNFLIALRLRVNDRGQRWLLWMAIGFNVLTLVLFRAASFFLPQFEVLLGRLGISTQAGGLQILVPLGLSYYVLQTISYLVDVYRGQLTAESDFVDFALYLAYFPKLIAGPIERARSFLTKLGAPRVVDNQVLAQSVMLIFVGMTRKLLIADLLTASFLTDVFEFPAKYNPLELSIWLVIYAVALYNDFAGYTDIVRGASGLFGIELAANFRTPYFSRSFTEFWKRWHITLSEWMRDYIYFPVSRRLGQHDPNSRSLAKLILPPMITMLVSGIWHGLSLHMLVWGGLHGIYQIIERSLASSRPVVTPQNRSFWWQGVSMAAVFVFVVLAWVPFRWEFPAAIDLWATLLNWSDIAIRYRRLYFVMPYLFASLLMDLFQYRTQSDFVFLKWNRPVQAMCIAAILLLVFIATGGDFKQPFVYQGF